MPVPLLPFHSNSKESTMLRSSGKGRRVEGLVGNVNVNSTPFPTLGSIRRSRVHLQSLGINPGQSQVNPFPKAADPNSAHFDPGRMVGSLGLTPWSYSPQFHASGPSRQTLLTARPNYRHQIQRKIAKLENVIFSQSDITKLLSTITKKKGERETFE